MELKNNYTKLAPFSNHEINSKPSKKENSLLILEESNSDKKKPIPKKDSVQVNKPQKTKEVRRKP